MEPTKDSLLARAALERLHQENQRLKQNPAQNGSLASQPRTVLDIHKRLKFLERLTERQDMTIKRIHKRLLNVEEKSTLEKRQWLEQNIDKLNLAQLKELV